MSGIKESTRRKKGRGACLLCWPPRSWDFDKLHGSRMQRLADNKWRSTVRIVLIAVIVLVSFE
jgi:hypothetical protein